MAKRAARRSDNDNAGTAASAASPRDAAIDALMALLAERDYGEIQYAEIATRAGLSLQGLRAAFGGKVAMLAAFSERIDLAVLAGGNAEGDSERDRLFDVLMRRFDALAPYRAGIKGLARSARRNPAAACAMLLASEKSMNWMLAAAGIQHDGMLGTISRGGAGMVFAEAMATWLDGDEPDNEKTMAALDKALRRGERVMGYVRDAFDFVTTFGKRARDAAGGSGKATSSG